MHTHMSQHAHVYACACMYICDACSYIICDACVYFVTPYMYLTCYNVACIQYLILHGPVYDLTTHAVQTIHRLPKEPIVESIMRSPSSWGS